ncbi:MAG: amino acid ABC transporter permease [Anaerolineae bacterium]|nr:MAG: amino acid ABC transporter permease [Anaerolineae bacterium]
MPDPIGHALDTATAPLEISAEVRRPVPSFSARLSTNLSDFPWWALIIFGIGALLVFKFVTDETYKQIIQFIGVGIRFTIIVTLSAYSIAIVLGLVTALGQLSSNVIARNAAVLYVQVVRGIPILVQIFIWALVLVPLGVGLINNVGDALASAGLLSTENALNALNVRDISFIVRGIIALAISYGAFSSEIFRAGIQSIGRGQVEAANSLGLTRFQSLRLIILPQAVRRVLPPLGNDFIAMLKESSLVSVIGVTEITQLSKKYAAASFIFPQTYYSLAFLYLSMTLVLSAGVKFMERRLKSG